MSRYIETVGYGLYKNHPKRKEKVVRETKTLIVTEFGRYDKKTGLNLEITNKSVGGFRLPHELTEQNSQVSK